MHKKKKKGEVATHPHTPDADTYSSGSAVCSSAQEEDSPHELDNQNKSDMPAHPNTSEATTTDQLYAQVDKKKVKRKKGEVATHSHTPEADAPMDQLYSQVDKKKKQKKCEVTIHPGADTAVDQLYAQVNKKKKKV